MKSKPRKQSKIKQIILAPLKILTRAMDFYMRSLEDCAGRVGYGGGMGLPTAPATRLPKSFSINSSKKSDNEEFRELMRVASTRGLENKVAKPTRQDVAVRSQSVALGKIGRIDEDMPCCFEEEGGDWLYPRSRSYAVKRNVFYR